MLASAPIRRLRVVLLILVCLAVATFASDGASTAQAQAVTDFELRVSSVTLPASGGTATVTVSIDPGESAVAAVGATVSIDPSAASITECVTLVGLGACGEPAPGQLNVQTVDPAGWATPTDLFRITYDVSALDEAAPIDLELLQAFDVSGVLIAGSITDGSIGVVVNGDVNCDGARTIGDALVIAQFVVSLRTAGACPLADPTTQIDLTAADVVQDGSITIGDALKVARCTVGLLDCDG